MTIQFQCNTCQQTLAVSDEFAGKRAKCPNCADVLDVPGTGQAQSQAFDSSPQLASAQGAVGDSNFGPSDENPYRSPVTTAPMPRVTGEFGKGSLDAGLALSTALNLFQANVGLLVGSTLVIFAITTVVGQINNVVVALAARLDGGQPGFAFIGALLFSQLFGMAVNSFFMIGMFRICLAIGRNATAEFGMLFSGIPYLVPFLMVNIAFAVMTTIGFLMLIVPGVFVVLTYWPAMWLSLDRKLGFVECFSMAGELASGNRWNALAMGVIAMMLSLLGVLICFVGLIVTVPIIYQMTACAYLMMTNQKFDGSLS